MCTVVTACLGDSMIVPRVKQTVKYIIVRQSACYLLASAAVSPFLSLFNLKNQKTHYNIDNKDNFKAEYQFIFLRILNRPLIHYVSETPRVGFSS